MFVFVFFIGGEYYCPSGWTHFGKRCFMFVDTPKMWTAAEVYCQFEGANLASIHSYEENHFVMSLTRGDTHTFPPAWIGGFDVIRPGFWMWSDGSKFYYDYWCDDHHTERNESCLKMNYGCNKLYTHSHKHTRLHEYKHNNYFFQRKVNLSSGNSNQCKRTD
uniref:C-type lectin domain-containing protein n=2 Tax=Lates calcarifer TaxID=8187 RepID=A0A4W6FF93_LATCA